MWGGRDTTAEAVAYKRASPLKRAGGSGIGVKTFLDETLPTGSAPVTYKITAVRSTARGNPAQFTVNFGVGGQTVTIVEGESLKIAA